MDIIQHHLSKDFNTIEIYPLSDLHLGDKLCDIESFKTFITFILKEPNRFIIYNGDNVNNAIKPFPSDCFEETMSPSDQVDLLKSLLKPVANRILLLVEGNHEARTTKTSGLSIVKNIAEYLNISNLYRQYEGFLKVSFGKKDNNRCQVYTIYVNHNGASRAKMEQVAIGTSADIYVFGHIHQKEAFKLLKRTPDLHNNNIIEQSILFVVSSHWLNYGGYGASKLYIPTPKGSVPVVLSGTSKEMRAIV